MGQGVRGRALFMVGRWAGWVWKGEGGGRGELRCKVIPCGTHYRVTTAPYPHLQNLAIDPPPKPPTPSNQTPTPTP